MDLNKIYNCDCLKYMKTLDDESVDCIITDPPYLYLKHKLDLQFNEKEFFNECYRILKKDSILCFFGRGFAFHKWNYICSKIGFKFKEELTLKDRVYVCKECGSILDRDINSAINIMKKILPRIGETFVEGSTAEWTWMFNRLNSITMQTNLNVIESVA